MIVNKRFAVAVGILRETLTLAELTLNRTGETFPATFSTLKSVLRFSRKNHSCPAVMQDEIDAAEIAIFKALDALDAYDVVAGYGNDQERLAYYWNEFYESFQTANRNLQFILNAVYKYNR